MKINILNVFDKLHADGNEEKKIVVTFYPSLETSVIEAGKYKTYELDSGDHLKIRIDANSGIPYRRKIVYHLDIHKHINFIKREKIKIHQAIKLGPNSAYFLIDSNSQSWSPTWYMKIRKSGYMNFLPLPKKSTIDDLIAEGNVEIGDDRQ